MVCIPCFIVPVLLFIWHKFVQPYVLRWWNPWQKKDEKGNIIKKEPDFLIDCKDNVCSLRSRSVVSTASKTANASNISITSTTSQPASASAPVDSKDD